MTALVGLQNGWVRPRLTARPLQGGSLPPPCTFLKFVNMNAPFRTSNSPHYKCRLLAFQTNAILQEQNLPLSCEPFSPLLL